jgi:tetratricopeptide (TPR) repeat protein
LAVNSRKLGRQPKPNFLGNQVRHLYCYPLALLFILAVSTPLLAQRDRDTYSPPGPNSFEVVGQVKLAITGLPGSRIPVRLERFGGGLVDQMDTDGTGRFRFGNIQRGYYRVIVNAIGYRPAQQDADLQVMSRAFLVFELTPANSEAAPVLDVIDARAPAPARNELIRGRTALAGKNYVEAVDHLQRAVSLYPEFYEAHLLLGTAFVNTREWKNAETAFQQAVKLKADSAPATLLLGEVYWRQNRNEEAEKTLLAGLKLDDKSWHGYFTLARLYWDLGNIPKAAPAIGHTLQLKPDFAEGHLLAGNILLRVNQQQRALAEYQEYLRLAPKGEFAVQTRELVEKLKRTSLDQP